MDFRCDLKVGIWVMDVDAEEPISMFPTPCPPVTIVDESEIKSCPGNPGGFADASITQDNNSTSITTAAPEAESSTTAKADPTPEIKEDENEVIAPIKTD